MLPGWNQYDDARPSSTYIFYCPEVLFCLKKLSIRNNHESQLIKRTSLRQEIYNTLISYLNFKAIVTLQEVTYLFPVAGCTKAFSQLSNLQSHSRCHQTDKPYKCNSCYKCFNEESALLEHIPKHKESKHVKTHICSYCGKSYTQETYLAKHMQKHADRLDKRAPIIGSGGQAGAGLMADPYAWSKMDPMAMYGYGGPGILGDPDGRDISAYSPPWPEVSRSTSAFSSIQPPASTATKSQEFETSHFPRQNGQVKLFKLFTAAGLIIDIQYL